MSGGRREAPRERSASSSAGARRPEGLVASLARLARAASRWLEARAAADSGSRAVRALERECAVLREALLDEYRDRHLRQGMCPSADEPDSRDLECPACLRLARADALARERGAPVADGAAASNGSLTL